MKLVFAFTLTLALTLAVPALAQVPPEDPLRSPSLQPNAESSRLSGGGEEASIPLPHRPSGRDADAWHVLVGRPVFSEDGTEVGEVADVTTGLDSAVTAVVVSLSAEAGSSVPGRSRRLIAVPWQWVYGQLSGNRVVLPSGSGLLAWAEETGATGGPGGNRFAGWRTSWLDGADAVLSDGVHLGEVDGFICDTTGQVAQVVVRSGDNGVVYAIPRERIHVEREGAVAIAMDHSELLDMGPWRKLSPEPQAPLASLRP
jgi:sporulation protein YlmC with PRC-barrel domain